MIDWMEWIVTAGLVAVIVLSAMRDMKMRNLEDRIRILEERYAEAWANRMMAFFNSEDKEKEKDE